jgi:non-ribosomal peptide synthetase component E (peptide arylation enzyme)
MSWDRGREEILGMLERGELGPIVADLDLATHLITSARRHLKSAEAVADEDPELAYAALWDAIRKAMTAMLQAQGLRPTTAGGHLAVQHAVRAQFGASMGALLRPVDRIRTTRRAVSYLDEETWVDAEAVRADLPAAQAIVDAAEKAVQQLPVFVR